MTVNEAAISSCYLSLPLSLSSKKYITLVKKSARLLKNDEKF